MNISTKTIIALCKILWELKIWRLKLLKLVLTELSLGIIQLPVFRVHLALKNKNNVYSYWTDISVLRTGQQVQGPIFSDGWCTKGTVGCLNAPQGGRDLSSFTYHLWLLVKKMLRKIHPGLKGAKAVTYSSPITTGSHIFNIQNKFQFFKLLTQF